jgi:hypothetical protein
MFPHLTIFGYSPLPIFFKLIQLTVLVYSLRLFLFLLRKDQPTIGLPDAHTLDELGQTIKFMFRYAGAAGGGTEPKGVGAEME